MNYSRHFIKGQKVILKLTRGASGMKSRPDSLIAIVSSCINSTLELSFPEPFSIDGDHLFLSNQAFEILSETEGTGISVHAIFKGYGDGNTIRFKLSGDLNHFNRRSDHRIELELWVGLEESPVSRHIIQERWQHQIKQLTRNSPRPKTANFAERHISLSSSGLGVNYKTPVQPGHYFMIYLDLNENSDLICAVGEVVRCEPSENHSFFIGLHFDLIEDANRQRIKEFVNRHFQPRQ